MKMKVTLLAGILALSLLSCSESTQYQAPRFKTLGDYERKISTQIPMAQTFFDQGLVQFYGFDWSESARSFKEAARLDPNCAICYWGLALALNNKINAPMTGTEFHEGEAAIHRALALSPHASPIEKELIQALALSYVHAPSYKKTESAFSCHQASNEVQTSPNTDKIAYIHAMKKIADEHPEDPDVQALYASSLFFLVAGNNPTADNPSIVEANRVLTQSLTRSPMHPGTNHYYVHITEPFSRPGDALASADKLVNLVPGSQHLVHMPSHIYFLLGRYHEASEANYNAIEAYKKSNQTILSQGFEPEINYLYFHNFDFLRSSAIMEGNQEKALFAARDMLKSPYPEWLANAPELQWFMPIPYFVEARFGLWDELSKEPKPDDKYGYALGMWHYGQGMALANTGHPNEALHEAEQLQKIVRQGSIDRNLGDTGVKLLTIANSVLYATISDKFGDEKLTLAHLTHAMKIQNAMPYHEPPDWYFPLMQALGDAHLKWGKPVNAKVMYELTLAQYPENGWSLYGLEKALRALGDNQKADLVYQQRINSWQYSDIPEPLGMF